MKLKTNLKIAAVILGTLPATLSTIEIATAQDSPTAGRNQGYQHCKQISKRILNAALMRSGGDRAQINSAYRLYYGNISRCKARYLRG